MHMMEIAYIFRGEGGGVAFPSSHLHELIHMLDRC